MLKPFRKIAIATVLSLPVVAVNVQSTLADQRDFIVSNESSIDIHYLFVSESGEEAWGADILGEEVVMLSGESGEVAFFDNSEVCMYDIKAVAADGETSVELYEVDLCSTTDVTFFDR